MAHKKFGMLVNYNKGHSYNIFKKHISWIFFISMVTIRCAEWIFCSVVTSACMIFLHSLIISKHISVTVSTNDKTCVFLVLGLLVCFLNKSDFGDR
jgi:hypothetical protein